MSNSSRRHLANAVRALAMDSVQKANSGHPGAPMGMADIAEVLWNDYMKHNPTNPSWADRDRFILSNGHGSMLIYSLLHLTGYDLAIDDLKQFRQLHSRTPGHPEYGYAPGVETTTGPLGQGITNGVGMALAEKTLAAQFNKPGHDIVDHNTYVFLGDGCLMEGISHEACSLAGTLGLGKLIAFWDDNGISIDGEVEGWFTDDTPGRFEAYGWQVIRNVDGHDAEEIKAAIETAKAETGKPTMVCCKTIIGFGSPNKAGSHDCHGAALGDEEIALVRKELGWESAPFEIPADVYAGWDNKDAGAAAESEWDARFEAYATAFPTEAAELKRRLNNELAADWDAGVDAFIAEVDAKGENIASRKASQNAIAALAKLTPEFLGGSADLAGSNLTLWPDAKPVTNHDDGNYVNYGVREFGMAAMINGISLHGGFVPYGATFLMFSEYARNALRMAALMKVRHIEVFTHDSIGLGEDGPTHQPVEQTATLRMIPNMDVWRPCDAVESAVSWKVAVKNQTGPSSLIFSRQNLPHQARSADQIKLIERGGYILKDCEGTPDAIIIGTGSEVSLAMEAAAAITDKKIRVVSMPSTNAFDNQDAAYKESVLPASVTARVAVEAGVTGFWAKYVGLNGKVVGIDTFGESAPAGELYKLFGITTEAVVAAVNEVA
ncbi:transketolase [Mariprofundus sp. EBB-1]|uniref:transketolase n=1 Tax=Mariprofundus sp. EBB-1 TaxID=2650971 RepID=UPI000EF232BE|nr:transketolase [Mariprofundus sp. EBB-1]RLL53710.1 transketolase [Mariprofundus sp. EBB-1]